MAPGEKIQDWKAYWICGWLWKDSFLNVGLSVRNPKLEHYITFETGKQLSIAVKAELDAPLFYLRKSFP